MRPSPTLNSEACLLSESSRQRPMSGQFEELVLPFNGVGSGDVKLGFRLGCKCLYWLKHLASPLFCFLSNFFSL